MSKHRKEAPKPHDLRPKPSGGSETTPAAEGAAGAAIGAQDAPDALEAHTPLKWDDGADGQPKGILLGQVRLRRADVVQWKGFATDRWDADADTRLVLMGTPPTHVVIEDVGGEHLCLSFDGIAFKYFQLPAEAKPL